MAFISIRRIQLALAALCLLVLPAGAQHLTVTRVVDGDTFELSDGRTARLVGIDTPEKHMSSKLRSDAERSGRDTEIIQKLGEAASQHARQLVEGKRVALEYDQNNAAQGHTDRYGRTLAYVWTVSESGNRLLLINRMLVRAGYAHAYLDYPSERGEEFLELERQAREEGHGLWGEGLLARQSGDSPASSSSDRTPRPEAS